MPIHHSPQAPLTVEPVEPVLDELPDDLDVQSSDNSGWLTILYRGEKIARYLPVHEIAELNLHLVVDKTKVGADEPDEVTGRLEDALCTLNEYGFEICREYTEAFVNGRSRQTLILYNSPVTEEQVVELAQAVLDASRYAIDMTVDQDTVEKPSD